MVVIEEKIAEQEETKQKQGVQETPWDKTKREMAEARAIRIQKLAPLDFSPQAITTTV